MKKQIFILTVIVLISGCKNQSANVNNELLEGIKIVSAHGMVVCAHPLCSITPVITEKNGKLFFVAGRPGGSKIPTTVFQIMINILDYNMKVSEAVDTGRFNYQWLPDWISMDANSIDSLILNEIKLMGHDFSDRQSIGSVNAIQILADGKLKALQTGEVIIQRVVTNIVN